MLDSKPVLQHGKKNGKRIKEVVEYAENTSNLCCSENGFIAWGKSSHNIGLFCNKKRIKKKYQFVNKNRKRNIRKKKQKKKTRLTTAYQGRQLSDIADLLPLKGEHWICKGNKSWILKTCFLLSFSFFLCRLLYIVLSLFLARETTLGYNRVGFLEQFVKAGYIFFKGTTLARETTRSYFKSLSEERYMIV